MGTVVGVWVSIMGLRCRMRRWSSVAEYHVACTEKVAAVVAALSDCGAAMMQIFRRSMDQEADDPGTASAFWLLEQFRAYD